MNGVALSTVEAFLVLALGACWGFFAGLAAAQLAADGRRRRRAAERAAAIESAMRGADADFSKAAAIMRLV
ncbi:MAG: hypothetical protein GC153_10165 [Alphaproteobacteria bacterium]|nr:hypothetical protein [Alphaproteobacteria bacterium]